MGQEHFASNLLHARLLALLRGTERGVGPMAVLACAPGERHTLGLIAIGIALRNRGWQTTYLGADTPIAAARRAADAVAPAIVVLSAAMPIDHEIRPQETIAFVCECGQRDCFERVYLARDQYEAVRRDVALFAVTPGHEIPGVEHVVDEHPGYVVVRKSDDVRDIVEDTDPRRQPDG